jgi:predicted permease
VPLAARRTLGLPARYDDAANDWLTLVARPRAGTPREAVDQEVLAIAASAGADRSQPERPLRVRYERFIDRHPEVREIARGGIIGVFLVTLVLFIACFNVAGLVLARSAERRRELSVRAALGASRLRISRQLLTEGLVLASIAGAGALLVSQWSASLLAVFSIPSPIPQRLHFVTDWRVFAFAAAAVAVAAVLPALAPLVQIVRTDLARWLGAAGTSAAGTFMPRRTRRAFVLVQVAGSTFLLAAALLFARHFIAQASGDTGFDSEHIALLRIDPTQYGYSPEAARSMATRVAERIATLPGVRAAGVADRVSFYVGAASTRLVSTTGGACPASSDCVRAGRYIVSRDYFDAMGIPLVQGRLFAPGELDATIVSAHAAATLWPGQPAVGQTFRVQPDGAWLRVVGVAADVKHRMMNEPAHAYFYQPLDTGESGQANIVARTAGDPAALLLPMRQAVHAIDPRVPAQSVETMEQRLAMPLWPARTTAGFVGACGAVAVLLSAIGLFGVTYFAVGQRRREFGVRLAIGAEGRDVQRQVVIEALKLAAPGIALGVIAAGVAALFLRSFFASLDVTSIVPYASAAAGQTLTMLLASWSPAVRASRSNPVDVLRAE